MQAAAVAAEGKWTRAQECLQADRQQQQALESRCIALETELSEAKERERDAEARAAAADADVQELRRHLAEVGCSA